MDSSTTPNNLAKEQSKNAKLIVPISNSSSVSASHNLASNGDHHSIVARTELSILRPSNLAPTFSAGLAPGLTGNGPASGAATIPPRPKPGRKPANDEPENKRKAQNRAAQRAFRERKMHGQQQLEIENKQLKAVNDQLSQEVQQRRAEAVHTEAMRAQLAQLKAELAESMRRESEIRGQNERNMNTLTVYQQRARDAEARADQYAQELEQAVAELRTLKMSKNGYPILAQQSENVVQPTAPVTSMVKPINGCGDCDENGDCPCVDTYLEPAPPVRPDALHVSHQSSISIDSLLTPTGGNPPGRINSIPELVSDHSSPEDMEIDFTHTYKARARPISKSERCGFCEEGGSCICAEAEAGISMPIPTETPKPSKPGTCAQCQQNPEQKAYCESLAQARMAARESPNSFPTAKRLRRMGPRDVQVPCAEAFVLYKRYSTSNKAPSYDEIYQTYMKSNPTSRRGTTVANPGLEPKSRQFSAYETDIAAVIATLHRQGTNSSGGDGHGQRISSENANVPEPEDIVQTVAQGQKFNNPPAWPLYGYPAPVPFPAYNTQTELVNFIPPNSSFSQLNTGYSSYNPSPQLFNPSFNLRSYAAPRNNTPSFELPQNLSRKEFGRFSLSMPGSGQDTPLQSGQDGPT